MSTNKTVIAAVPDIFFGSKISGSAKSLGVDVKFVRNQEALLRNARELPALLVIDLGANEVDPIESIRALQADETTSQLTLVAFANHEREDLMTAARDAGCSNVLTRGAFASALPQLLAKL